MRNGRFIVRSFPTGSSILGLELLDDTTIQNEAAVLLSNDRQTSRIRRGRKV